MYKRLVTLLLVVSVSYLLQGCTYRAWYEGFKEGQRQECYKYESPHEILECLESLNNMTYEEYKKTREDLIKESE